jgi:hypothetical protein
MNDKISKQKIYTDFSIRLDKLEYKLDKLLTLMEKPIPEVVVNLKEEVENLGHKPFSCPDVTPRCIDGTGPCKCSVVMTNQEFDEFFK